MPPAVALPEAQHAQHGRREQQHVDDEERLLRVREEDVDVGVNGVGRSADDYDDAATGAQQAAEKVATSEALAQRDTGDEGVGQHGDRAQRCDDRRFGEAVGREVAELAEESGRETTPPDWQANIWQRHSSPLVDVVRMLGQVERDRDEQIASNGQRNPSVLPRVGEGIARHLRFPFTAAHGARVTGKRTEKFEAASLRSTSQGAIKENESTIGF